MLMMFHGQKLMNMNIVFLNCLHLWDYEICTTQEWTHISTIQEWVQILERVHLQYVEHSKIVCKIIIIVN